MQCPLLQVKDRFCHSFDSREGYERIGEDEDNENNEINNGNIQEDVEATLHRSMDEQIHTIVLDMAPVSFVDSAGAKAILHVRIYRTLYRSLQYSLRMALTYYVGVSWSVT